MPKRGTWTRLSAPAPAFVRALALRADAGGQLRFARFLDAADPAAVAETCPNVRERAVHEFIDEILDVRATLGLAVGDAAQAELGRDAAKVDAPKGAGDDLEAADDLAVPAVLVAVGARFVGALADRIAANRTHAAVLLTRGAVLTARAHSVATAGAFSTVFRAGKAGLGRREAVAIAAIFADSAIRRARDAIFSGRAKAVPAGFARTAILWAARAALARVAGFVAARLAKTAIERATRAVLEAVVANLVAATQALAAVEWAARAILSRFARGVAARLAHAAVTDAIPASLVLGARPVAASLAEPAIGLARRAGLVGRARAVAAAQRRKIVTRVAEVDRAAAGRKAHGETEHEHQPGEKGASKRGNHRLDDSPELNLPASPESGDACSMLPQECLAAILEKVVVDPSSSLPPSVQKALVLARHLQKRGVELQTSDERRQQAEFERMMQSPTDKATLTQITDQAFRARTPRRAAEQLTHILDVQGVPRFFSPFERAMLKGFQSFGSYLPGVSMPMVKERMRAETANVILPAEHAELAEHLRERARQGVRMNVNYLGEALLGEAAARERFQSYLAALTLPEIEVISVKVSTIDSQITSLGRRHAVKLLADRLELLYRAAAKARFERPDGTRVPKFVYLDMEEYRDLGLTAEAFMRTLERPGLEGVDAGIALQAYIPDSFLVQQQLLAWAKKRIQKGGSPVTVRLVKGANMESERFEASVGGWEQAPFQNKIETDANYKRMLKLALTPDHVAAMRVGVASHNVFEIAYALVLASEQGIESGVQYEMLEGMANHQRRAICELAPDLLLYAPATRREEFISAIGYLIRRLDENTGPENFLRHAFKLEVDSKVWRELEKLFLDSFELQAALPSASRRTQNRNEQPKVFAARVLSTQDFDNDPATEFSLEHNLEWAEALVRDWHSREGQHAVEVPLVLAGEDMFDREIALSFDPSRPGVVVARHRLATSADIDRAIACAVADPKGWRTLGEAERASTLSRVAHELRKARGELIGAALADGGKTVGESDPEIAEAIDFVEYYAATARDFRNLKTVAAKPKGVVAVVSPWNFPVAIPCGGIVAGLAAGNTVIVKPSPHTVLCAYVLCQCFWRAGVPKEALQLAPCSVEDGGRRLVGSSAVDVVILTGGTATALRMLEAKPDMNLLAETGGKNATIVTAMSDRDLAIKHILHSAFGHSGQKCSATSLFVLEGEVYDDPEFQKTLLDAIASLKVGSSWAFDTRLGPLIVPPTGHLLRGLKELDDGESWALLSENLADNPCLYSPAVKWGVRAGSYSHLTEFFGPVLSVMRADDLAHAIQLVNQTGYGLTSGIESLDEREQTYWREHLRAGNLYVNRVTTGAIVLRQPFGGVGKSAFGPGIKAGGPNYVAQLMNFADRSPAPEADKRTPSNEQAVGQLPLERRPYADAGLEQLRAGLQARSAEAASESLARNEDARRLLRALQSYDSSYRTEFGVEHDHFKLVGQDNLRRYQPVPRVHVRVHREDSVFDVVARVAGARTVGAGVVVSLPPRLVHSGLEWLEQAAKSWGAMFAIVEETDAELATRIKERGTDRVRYAGASRVPRAVLDAVGDTGVYVAHAPVLGEGLLELLWYVSEQSISHDYHRYGNLGGRNAEARRAVL